MQAGKLPPFTHQWEQRPAHSGFKSILTVSSACTSHEHGDGTPVVTTCSEATEVKVWAVNSSGDGGEAGRNVSPEGEVYLEEVVMAPLSPSVHMLQGQGAALGVWYTARKRVNQSRQ